MVLQRILARKLYFNTAAAQVGLAERAARVGCRECRRAGVPHRGRRGGVAHGPGLRESCCCGS